MFYRHDPKPDSGRVPTEIRLNRTPLRQGEFVHVRKWFLPPEGGTEFRPTRYGVAIPVDFRTLYGRAKNLPFTRRLSRRCLRFDPDGLRRWVTNQR